MFYFIPSWVSSRLYKTDTEIKAVLVNEIDKEFIILEDNSAKLWKVALENENRFDAKIIANKLKKPEFEVKKFLINLENIRIIQKLNTSKEYVDNKFSINSNENTADRYTSGNYNEPVPGGSNLDEEYSFMDWVEANGFLYSTTWELTYRCNERCIHCFNPGASHVEGDKSFRKVKETDFEKIIKVLDDFKSIGVFRIMITGGELFIRKDIFKIIEEIKKRRFSLTIFTNGTLLGDNEIDKLANYYPSRIELSLYSHKPEAHDKITRLKGSWEKTVKTALKIKKKNIDTFVKMIVTKDTVQDIEGFEKFCKNNDFDFAVDFNMSAGVDGNQFPIENLLADSKELILQCFNKSSPLYIGELSYSRKYDAKKLKGQHVCGAGRNLMSISAEGNISPCNSLPLECGNINSEKLSDIWKQSSIGKKEKNNAVYSKKKSESSNNSEKLSSWQGVRRGDYEVCGNFERCNWCQKCPGLAYLETGSELKPSTTNCRNSAARMIAFDLLKRFKTKKNIIKNFNLDSLKRNYKKETALWNPSENMKSNRLESFKSVILKRTKPSALEKLIVKEGLNNIDQM